jgi:hypothetical protein
VSQKWIGKITVNWNKGRFRANLIEFGSEKRQKFRLSRTIHIHRSEREKPRKAEPNKIEAHLISSIHTKIDR